jgi:hypothetical protein
LFVGVNGATSLSSVVNWRAVPAAPVGSGTTRTRLGIADWFKAQPLFEEPANKLLSLTLDVELLEDSTLALGAWVVRGCDRW